nr:MAG TPA: hypothetical protein [Caudoviricetes sp.]
MNNSSNDAGGKIYVKIEDAKSFLDWFEMFL